MRNYLDVDVKNIPYIFQITLVGDTYDMRIDYNEVADYYTITIWHNNKRLLTQEPLLLGQLVGIDIPDPELPRIDIRTMDETGKAREHLDMRSACILTLLTQTDQKQKIHQLNRWVTTLTKMMTT